MARSLKQGSGWRLCFDPGRVEGEAIEFIKDFLKVAGDGETEMRQVFEPGMDFARG